MVQSLGNMPGFFKGVYRVRKAPSLYAFAGEAEYFHKMHPLGGQVPFVLAEWARHLSDLHLDSAFIRETEGLGIKAASAIYLLLSPSSNYFLAGFVKDAGELPSRKKLSEFFVEEKISPSLSRLPHASVSPRMSHQGRIMHDIRAPLTSLFMTFENLDRCLAEKKDIDGARTLVAKLKNQASYMEQLTHDFLYLETGRRRKVEAETFSMNEEIQTIIASLTDSLTRRKISLVMRTDGDILVHLPRLNVRRILYNLISNAQKFCSSPGKIHLSLKKRQESILFEVEDSGSGLPLSHLKKDAFLELSRKNMGRSGGGWGIGLASASELAVDCGGALVPQAPKYGEGANFLLVLPVRKLYRGSGDNSSEKYDRKPVRFLSSL